MNIKQLSKEMAKETGMSQLKCYSFIIKFIALITKLVVKGHEVKLKNFLTVYADIANPKEINIPGKEEKIQLGRRFVLRLKPSIVFKKKVNVKKTY